MGRVLPPGIAAAQFDQAMDEFRAIVGKAWVFTTEEDVALYRDPYSPLWDDSEEYLASAAVAPDTAEQVQKIVLVANKYRIPLYPISTGKNLAYGGPAPTYSGSVIVDLKRMNRIINVDDKRNFALVEPGVSYFDLYRHIQERGLKVWIDCPDPGWGSPIGNALDHGMGYTSGAFRDHFGAHCGMEVVTPTGEIMRTGMGALPGSDSWQDYRYGVGPFVDGLFGQANFGIVTKMGFWLMPQPEAWAEGTISVPNYKDLQPLIEHMSYLEDSQIMNGLPSYISPVGPAGVFGSLSGSTNEELTALMANGWPSDDQIEAYAKKRGGPAWEVTLQFFGPEEVVRAKWDYAARRIGAAIPGSKFKLNEVLPLPLTDAQANTHHMVNFGVPSLVAFYTMARKPTDPPNPRDGHVDLIVICPRTADALFKAKRIVFETHRSLGVPSRITPFDFPIVWPHRAFMVGVPGIAAYRDNPEGNAQSRKLYAAMVKNLAAAGFGAYRTPPFMQDLVVSQYSFNDHALLRFQEKLKDGVDPNGIMAPGRYGIWPKHLRDRQRGRGVGG